MTDNDPIWKKLDAVREKYDTLTLPQHCYICGMLIRKSEILDGSVIGGRMFNYPGKSFLVHRACADKKRS